MKIHWTFRHPNKRTMMKILMDLLNLLLLIGMSTYIFAAVEDRKERRQQNIACVVVDSLH
jgi:hypothetical protein